MLVVDGVADRCRISSYSQAKLNAVARQLNERPRKTLGFQTPAEMFSQTVASTGLIRRRRQPFSRIS